MIDPNNPSPELTSNFDVFPLAIVILDHQCHCTYANLAWENLSGQSRTRALNDGWSSRVADTSASQVSEAITLLRREHHPLKLELKYKSTTNQTTWVIADFAPLIGDSGNSLGFICTLTNINDLKTRLERSEKRASDLDNLNKLLIDRELKMIELKKQLKNSLQPQ